MLKQTSSRMKKIFAISLAVLFVGSLTAVAASVHYGGGGHRGGYGGFGGFWGGYGWEGYPWGYEYPYESYYPY